MYAFAVLNPTTYTIEVYDTQADIVDQQYAKFVSLKKKNSNLKTMISMGGWNDSNGAAKYSTLVASSTNIAAFVKSATNFLQTYGFDGLDIDWEYPSSAADKVGFVKLLAALRAAFTANGYLLTVAVAASPANIDAGYDVPNIDKYVDFYNLMTYDYHGSWETQADHHAPLYKRLWDKTNFWVDDTVSYWMSKGATSSKLILGIPTYGRSWTLSTSVTPPPAPDACAGTAGQYTAQTGFLAYYEICSAIQSGGWTVVTNPGLLMGPYSYSLSTKQWVGYDDVNMAIHKTSYALSKGLGGVMVWDMSMDDFHNTCSAGVNPLMTAISNTLAGGSNATTTATSPTTTGISSTTNSAPTTKSTVQSTTASPTTTGKPLTTTKTNLFTCPSPNGLFANPSSCSSFYNCGYGIAYLTNCPTGLDFNPTISACDWPYNVKCSSSG